MRVPHFGFFKKNVSYSLLTMLTIALLFACKKSDNVIPQRPVISYQQKIISVAVDVPMMPVRPDSSGGAISEYSINPTLPKGVEINKANGVISGTPSDTLTPTRFIVTAKGPGGMANDTLMIAIGTVGFNYGMNSSYTFTNGDATLSTTPLAPTVVAGTFVRYMISSPYPDSLANKTGLSFDPSTGKISGTANRLTSTTASPVAAVFTITGITTNSKAASTTVSITVNDVAPAFSYAFKGSLSTGVNYVDSSSVAAGSPNIATPIVPTSTGSTIKAYRLAPNSPALPAGLSLDSTNGRIYGNPTTAGTTNVVIRALSAGGANPTNFTVPVVITSVIQAPMISYAMVVNNKAILATGGNTYTATDTLVSSIPSNALMYLTNNTTLASTGGYQGTYSGTSLQLIPITTQGQVSSFGALSPTITGLPNHSSGTFTLSNGNPKVTSPTATSSIALNNAIPGGTAGSFGLNISSNAPYVTYNTAAGNVGSTNYCANKRSFAYPNAYFFIKGRAITAAPNGTDSCYYTAAQLSPSTASATSYSIYPAQLLPGLSFNTTTGALSGTPTMNTNFGTIYNFVSYTVVGRKADGSFTLYQILVKVFDNASDYQNTSIYP